MRYLIYVPVIHSSADLGSLAKDVNKRGAADLGDEAWREHHRIVEGFWDAVVLYFNFIDGQGLKIYQDGMVADGEIGKKIVEEGVKSASQNYELVSRLIKDGAVLVKTEDFNLVKEERDRLIAIINARSPLQKLAALVKYKLIKNRLLKKRDKFIAQRINETLKDGERGVLFIGAFHNVKKWLAKDILLEEIKDMHKIREYYSLLPLHDRNCKHLEEIGRYIISKVVV